GIPANAFAEASKLTSITIPETFTTIGQGAFSNTPALASITIPANVTSIEQGAFVNSGLTTITFASGSKLASIGQNAFVGSDRLTSITIPASVITIGASAFSNNPFFAPPGTLSLTAIDVDPANPNYKSIDGVLFDKDATTLIQYPSRKSNTTYSIPAGVTSIGKEAFSRSTLLTSVTIPASVATIAESAFRGTTSLSSVNIPASVTGIGNNAFFGASTLANITFTGNAAPTIGSGAFTGVASSAKACVKTGATGFTTSGSPARWNGIGVNDGAYMASFNANGGSTVAGVSFLANGQISSAPTEPTKAGHTFAGWTATDGGSTIVTFPHTPSATCGTTLHAKWDLIPVVNEPAPLVNNPAPAVSNSAPAAASTSTAQTATTNVVSAKANYTAKSLATQVGVTTVSPKATVTISVAKSSKKFCTKSGSKLKTLKAGSCVVTITVQEPKPKGGKKPKATKTTKTLVVS
ncbi:MAG: leucine-rich repeat protein, partial [Actinobacteria bacterium]|nr:leucine-rich repeat protein [Actinomycetota bacterium]